jgi:hypothetical protein
MVVAVADRLGVDGPGTERGVLGDTGIGRLFFRRTFGSAV